MSKPSLSYFSSRGLIEPIRLLLADAKVDYEKKELGVGGPNVPKPEAFISLKESGILDFGSVPLWEEEGLQLVQSASIARHLGRKYGYSGENENEASKVDAVIEGVRDTLLTFRRVAVLPDDQKEQAWKEILATEIPKWIGFFETILKKNGSGFFVGKKVSVADFYVFGLVEELNYAQVSLEPYPLLKSHFDSISCRPNIASYISSPSRYPTNLARFFKK